MATTFDEVRTLIDEEITTNGQQEITGQVLNNVLTEMTDVTEEQIAVLETETNEKLTELESEVGLLYRKTYHASEPFNVVVKVSLGTTFAVSVTADKTFNVGVFYKNQDGSFVNLFTMESNAQPKSSIMPYDSIDGDNLYVTSELSELTNLEVTIYSEPLAISMQNAEEIKQLEQNIAVLESETEAKFTELDQELTELDQELTELESEVGVFSRSIHTINSLQNITITNIPIGEELSIRILSESSFNYTYSYRNNEEYSIIGRGNSNEMTSPFVIPADSIDNVLYITIAPDSELTFELIVYSLPLSMVGGVFELIPKINKFEAKSFSYSYAGGPENYSCEIEDLQKGDRLLIGVTSDKEFSIEVLVRTETAYVSKGIVGNGEVVSIEITEDIISQYILFTYSGSESLTVDIEILKSDTFIEKALNFSVEKIDEIDDKIEYPFIKNYSVLSEIEKQVVSCIKDVNLQVEESLAIKDLYLRVLGVYDGNFFIQIWNKEDNIMEAQYDVPVSSLGDDLVNITLTAVTPAKLKANITIDASKVSTSFINQIDNNLSLVVNEVFPNGYFNIESQVKPNLFSLDDSLYDTYMKEGVVYSISGFVMSNYIAVEPSKIYKCSTGIPFINFFNYDKEYTRGLTQYDTPDSFCTEPDEYYVVVSISTSDLESIIIQEVVDAAVEIDYSNVAIKPHQYISDGGYAVGKISGNYGGRFAIGKSDVSQNTISLVAEQKLFATSIVGSYRGKVKKLRFYCECDNPFYLKIGIGNIDQRNWGLISRAFDVFVQNGYNEININQIIAEDERLFIIANTTSSSVNAKLYIGETGIHYEEEDGDLVMAKKKGFIAIEYTIEGDNILSTSSLVNENQLNSAISNVNDSINNISLDNLFLTSPNGDFYRLKVSNSGELQIVQVPVQGTFLIMGNSYDVHDYVEGLWWGDFGMAASRKENDWKHQLLSKLRKNDELIYNFQKQALASWETTWNKNDSSVIEDTFTYSDETLPAFANGVDYSMIIIRVGENNTDTNYERVELRVRNLLNYITSKVGTDVPILLGACVKIRTGQNPSFQAVAEEFSNVTFVDMTPAGRLSTFEAGLDYKVLGDDGVWHTISESSMADSVAGHPNDAVFAKMAELFYPVVLSKLVLNQEK